MMTEPILETDLFQKSLERLYRQIALENPLQRMRARAWEQFLEIGLPTRHTEEFRYLKMKKLFGKEMMFPERSVISSEKMAKAIYPECENSLIVCVNGFYEQALSRTAALSKRVVILPLDEAVRTYGTFLNNHWTRSIKEEKDAFALLNAALHQQGVFVYVPPKYQGETPIQILHITDSGNFPFLINPKVQFFLGSQSSVKVISSHLHVSGLSPFINQVTDFSFEDGASLHYVQSSMDLPNSVWLFDATRAFLKRDGKLETVSLTEGSASIRSDYRISLSQENSEATLNGLWMLNEKNESHTHVFIDHQAPNCRSMQLFKGVLNDTSISSFEGKILVRKLAQKTQAFQLNHNLLLSDRAHADSKPNLEIFADDVKASHGATVGQLDQEQLFYLAARGFSKEKAKNILVHGFCQEVIEKIGVPSLKNSVSNRALRFIQTGHF